MNRSLPPLNALRAFEAAARLQSYTAAARELGVTQGAISRQIQLLEAWLGCKLFVRDRQGVQTTAAARELCAQATAWFDQIENATQRIKAPRSSRQLRVKLPPTFAIQWLMPRLARFHALHPEIEVQITTSHLRTDWHTEDVDVSIRSEAHDAVDGSAVQLFPETLIPVCAPSLLRSGPKIRSPRDLLKHDLLCSTNRPDDWPQWFSAAGIDNPSLPAGLQFENAALAYQAAANGLGVMIALMPFVAEALNEGRLTCPLKQSAQLQRGYYLTHSPLRAPSTVVRHFKEWLCTEARV
jgi:LysR family glycine cleavage system transcriptional activator